MPTPGTHTFAEKVALITDGAEPVGRAIALQLALYGAYVIVGYPENSPETESALGELRALGTLANAVEADPGQCEGAKLLVDETEKLFGRLDLLINTRTARVESGFRETDEAGFTGVFDACVKSTFFVTREALRLMEPRPKPVIVNVAYGGSENPALSAAQAALIGLTKSLAKELGTKFRVNCVEILRGEDRFPKKEILDPELFRPKRGIPEDDVARAVIYLLSSEAVGLNGQVLSVG
ncbi:MAG: SDR family oxidoreductase [Pyrinomonadaceae bacterium]